MLLAMLWIVPATANTPTNDSTAAQKQAWLRGCLLAYYPSDSQARVAVDFSMVRVRLASVADMAQKVDKVHVAILSSDGGQPLAQTTLNVTDGRSAPQTIALPPLQGDYIAQFTIPVNGTKVVVDQPFQREKFAWENNQLGVTDAVYAPFKPVVANANGQVQVVDRTYQLNGLGLFEQVESLGQALLAEPMTLRYKLASGETGEIKPTQLTLESTSNAKAVYRGQGVSPIVRIEAEATVEFDGMVKVQWTLRPGQKSAMIDRMWLNIPLKPQAAELMHNITDGNRIHHAGRIPKGDGVVWTSAEARRQAAWQNTFNPYLWLGRETRGLAWFAENDKDWLTERDGSDKPIQQVVRTADAVSMQVFFINTPSKIEREHHIVFGLQASPTKPRPEGWRKRDPMPPAMSGPVNAWGAIQCAAKAPYKKAWEVPEKINEARRTGEYDREWFERWAEEHNPPLVHGRINWVDRTTHFAKREARSGPDQPALIYFEEMRASTIEPDWQTFQDEWGTVNFTDRNWPDESVMRRGFNASPAAGVTFVPSYRDFGAYYADQWLQRGIGLYWDNTYPQVSYDTQTSVAYVTDDGEIQPALTIFNQREYQKRIWNLLQQYRAHSDMPLEWSVHMTSTLLLPLQTFATIQLDHELNLARPAEPDYIRTTMLGLKCGNLPFALHELSGRNNPVLEPFREMYRERIEWGMRRVHEIAPSHSPGRAYQPFESILRGFGYGQPDVQLMHYWDTTSPIKVDPQQVKWLALESAKHEQTLLILSSWLDQSVRATATFAVESDGQPLRFIDAETGQAIESAEGQSVDIEIPGPYGVRLVLAYPADAKADITWPLRDPAEITAERQPRPDSDTATKNKTATAKDLDPYRGIAQERILFREDFEDGLNPEWMQVQDVEIVTAKTTGKQADESSNHVARITERKQRLVSPPVAFGDAEAAASEQTMQPWRNYAMRMRFRVGEIEEDSQDPARVATLFQLLWRHHPTEAYRGEAQLLYFQIDRSSNEWRIDGPRVAWPPKQQLFDPAKTTVAPPMRGMGLPVDQQWHELEVRLVEDRTQVRFDGQVMFDGRDARAPRGGFIITSLWNQRATPTFLEIDDVVAWSIDRMEPTSSHPPITASRVEQAPTIDGKLDDATWSQLRHMPGTDVGPWYLLKRKSDEKPLPDVPRQAWLAYDDENLYIAMQAQTPDAMALRPGPPGNPFRGDGMEVHLKTDGGDYLLFGIDIDGQIGAGLWNTVESLDQIEREIQILGNQWTAELAIPWRITGTSPEQGTTPPRLNLAANQAYQGHDSWQPLTITPGQFDVRNSGRRLQWSLAPQNAIVAQPASQPPKLDGSLDDTLWRQAAENGATASHWQTTNGQSLAHPRTAYFAFDDQHLYVAVSAKTPHVAGPITSDGQPMQGDNVRLDFPDYALGVDATGRPLNILLPYLIPVKSAASQSKEGWSVELAIPWEQIGGRPKAQVALPFNIAGHDSSEGFVTWQPVKDARDINQFGSLLLPPANRQ